MKSDRCIRLVVHRDITDHDVEDVIAAMQTVGKWRIGGIGEVQAEESCRSEL